MIDKNVIETRGFYIKPLSDTIIRVEKKLGVNLKVADLDENALIFENLLNGKKGLFLIIFELDCTSDNAFKARVSDSERSHFKKAEAIVIKSLANRIEANFYKNNFTPSHPLNIFTDEEEALEWLKSMG